MTVTWPIAKRERESKYGMMIKWCLCLSIARKSWLHMWHWMDEWMNEYGTSWWLIGHVNNGVHSVRVFLFFFLIRGFWGCLFLKCNKKENLVLHAKGECYLKNHRGWWHVAATGLCILLGTMSERNTCGSHFIFRTMPIN